MKEKDKKEIDDCIKQLTEEEAMRGILAVLNYVSEEEEFKGRVN